MLPTNVCEWFSHARTFIWAFTANNFCFCPNWGSASPCSISTAMDEQWRTIVRTTLPCSARTASFLTRTSALVGFQSTLNVLPSLAGRYSQATTHPTTCNGDDGANMYDPCGGDGATGGLLDDLVTNCERDYLLMVVITRLVTSTIESPLQHSQRQWSRGGPSLKKMNFLFVTFFRAQQWPESAILPRQQKKLHECPDGLMISHNFGFHMLCSSCLSGSREVSKDWCLQCQTRHAAVEGGVCTDWEKKKQSIAQLG